MASTPSPADRRDPEHPTIDELEAEVAWYQDQLHAARSALTGIAAIAGPYRRVLPDEAAARQREYARRLDRASDMLRGMFVEAARRPEASETPHVEHLERPLREILRVLDGGDAS